MSEQTKTEETWVNVTEAAEITGYNRDHMKKLARDNWNTAEENRKIRVRRLTNGYLLWLPDIVYYIENYGMGPIKKKSERNS